MQKLATQLKQRSVAQKMIQEKMTATNAYKSVYGGKMTSKTASANSSRLLATDSFKKELKKEEAISQQTFKDLSAWAIEGLKQLINSPTTPASVKQNIYKDMLDRAGHTSAQRIETKTEVQYKEYDMNTDQLQAYLDEIKPHSEPTG